MKFDRALLIINALLLTMILWVMPAKWEPHRYMNVPSDYVIFPTNAFNIIVKRQWDLEHDIAVLLKTNKTNAIVGPYYRYDN